MKRIFSILVINIFVFTLFLILFDFLYSFKDYSKRINYLESHAKNLNYEKKDIEQIPQFIYTLKHIPFKEFYKKEFINFNDLRRRVDGDKNKPPILIFGDSFAEGAWLEDYQTLNYKLSKLTNRTVFNFGFSGTGPAEMLWQVRNEQLYQYINNNSSLPPDYAIYILIPNHLLRAHWSKFGTVNGDHIPYIGYKKNKDGTNLIEDNNFILNQIARFSIFRKLIEEYTKNQIYKDIDDAIDFVSFHFIKAREELQKRYSDIKFIILKHPQFSNLDLWDMEFFESSIWKELENNGFLIYDLSDWLGVDIINRNYQLPDSHPNENLWSAVSIKLKEDLNL